MADEPFSKKQISDLNSLKVFGVKAPQPNPNDYFERASENASIEAMKRSAKFSRKADAAPFSVGGAESFSGSSSSVSRVPLMYLDPLFDPILMLFPKNNLRELNRRLRHYYIYQPYVRNIINLHAEFPVSDFALKCQDRDNEDYFNDYSERKNLLELAVQKGRDFHLLGESFTYCNFDPYELEFASFNQYPPEEIEIFKTYISDKQVFMIKASDDIKKLLSSSQPADKAIAQVIAKESPQFYQAMLKGRSYKLNSDRLMHLAARPNRYTQRGTSPVLSIVKDLLYEDKLRMLQYTFIDRQAFPIKHWKIGSVEKGWVPPAKKFREFEQLLLQAVNDPDFQLITHPFIQHDWVTPKDMVKDLIPDYEWVAKRIMVGLFVNDAVLHGELGPYASQAISIKVLMNKYLTYRALLEHEFTQKIFRPIAVARKMIIRKQADLDHNVRTSKGNYYDVPKFMWQKLNLLNNTQLQEYVLRIREKGDIPFKLVADIFDWDTEHIKKMFTEEQSTPLDPIYRAAVEERAKDEAIRDQILEGKKVKDWPKESDEERSTGLEESAELGRPLTSTPSVPSTPTVTKVENEEPTPKPPLGETESPI